MNSIHDICKRYNITNYTVNDDGSIDVNGNVKISFHKFTELPIRFNKVLGSFSCSNNKLTTLKGCPRWVGNWFSCEFNDLTTLEFAPDYVGGWFSCVENEKLTDNYCDTEIIGQFHTRLKEKEFIYDENKEITNYNEWRKLYKRRFVLNKIFDQ